MTFDILIRNYVNFEEERITTTKIYFFASILITFWGMFAYYVTLSDVVLERGRGYRGIINFF